LQQSQKYFYAIRTIRIVNEKQDAPKASDVQFDDEAESAEEATAEPAAVGTTFVLPEEGEPAAAAAAPAEETAEPVGNERILKQVLGAENIHVFLRIDVVLFDEPKPATR
jgi:hypothetical protein